MAPGNALMMRRALGIGAGDEVITTPMTAFATTLAIIRAGAVPVLADIDPETALLDPRSVARCIGPRTKAVLLVHLYGQIDEMSTWTGLCDKHGLSLLEDCAQSHLAACNGLPAGAFGRFGAYSFYPTKNLGAVGDAGALVTSDEALAAKARMLRNYGQTTRYEHALLGMNSRLDEIHAAMLRARLDWLGRFTARRRAIGARYLREIRNPAIRVLRSPVAAERHSYHLFVVRCTRRDELSAHLKARGIENLAHYPIPVHKQPAAAGMKRDPSGLGASERHADECLSIPCHHNLADIEVGAVVEALNAFA